MAIRFLTVRQASRKTGISEDTIRDAIKTGKLRKYPLPHYGVVEADLISWLETQTSEGEAQ